MIRYTCPQQVTIPRRFQEIYVMTVVILSSFLISPKLKYRISIGSSIFVQKKPKKQSLVVFQALRLCLFFACINLILLYCLKSLEHFAKLKTLLHLGVRLCRSCCLVLLFPGEAHFCTLTTKDYVPDTIVIGQEDQV